MQTNFSAKLKDIISSSREEAIKLGNDCISVEHLLLAIIKERNCNAFLILDSFNIDFESSTKYIEELITIKKTSVTKINKIPLAKLSENVVKNSVLEAKNLKKDTVDSEHLLLSLFKLNPNISTYFPLSIDLKYDSIYEKIKLFYSGNLIENVLPENILENTHDEEEEENKEKKIQNNSYNALDKTFDSQKSKKRKTPVLDSFGNDLNKSAIAGKIDQVIGREIEIERVIQILCRRKKNNPLLIGEPGVGKSAIAEGLALKIVEKKVPHVLIDKRIVSLDLSSLVAGTKYRGQFEERMKALLNEIINNKDVILFIDEIHTLVGAGGASGSLDASNIFKPALARGEIQCIGATTIDEHRTQIEKDGALDRRFQKVMIDPTDEKTTKLILNSIKKSYEDYHLVTFTDKAIEAAVILSDRYITDKHQPDKALDVIDEAGSRMWVKNIQFPQIILDIEKKIDNVIKIKDDVVKKQNYEEAAKYRDQERKLLDELDEERKKWTKDLEKFRKVIDEEHINEVISFMTGIPTKKLNKNELIKLKDLNAEFKKNIIGQDEAIDKVVKSIQRNKTGLRDPNKPIGVYMFLGPTGVGKTELAKEIAIQIFGSNKSLHKIDMSEYMEKFTTSRLIGAPPGYVGYDEGGQLTEKVRKKPYCVILLDEIEKAHPDIFNILLQMFDEGVLTDGSKRKVDFKNTIIILTSNIGSRKIRDFGAGVGFMTADKLKNTNENIKSTIQQELKKTFSPEFINRIDEIVLFNSLTEENLMEILELEIKKIENRISDKNIKIKLTNQAKKFLITKGFDAEFGARLLKRTLQNHIENLISDGLIDGVIASNSTIKINLNTQKNCLEIEN